MTRYRYKGRFISAGDAARYANLRGAKNYLSTEIVEARRPVYRTTGFYRPEEAEERRDIQRERAAPPPVPAPREDYYEPPEPPAWTPRDIPPEWRDEFSEELEDLLQYYDPDVPLAEQEMFGLTPLMDEAFWMGELFDDDFDDYLDDVDDEGGDYEEA